MPVGRWGFTDEIRESGYRFSLANDGERDNEGRIGKGDDKSPESGF